MITKPNSILKQIYFVLFYLRHFWMAARIQVSYNLLYFSSCTYDDVTIPTVLGLVLVFIT